MKRVLIVEDDNDLARLYEKVLARSGCETEIVGSVDDAIRNLVKLAPDVVLLDWVLGHETSEVLLRYLQSFEATRPRVLLVSGRIRKDKLRLYAGVVDQVLQKPVSMESIAAAVAGTGACCAVG